MKRSTFLKILGIGSTTAAIAPGIMIVHHNTTARKTLWPENPVQRMQKVVEIGDWDMTQEPTGYISTPLGPVKSYNQATGVAINEIAEMPMIWVDENGNVHRRLTGEVYSPDGKKIKL